MKLTNWLPRPLQRFVRERMTIYVYTYGFRPSAVVEEQALKFRISGRELTVKADYRTALYDMITEVVDYDAYQLQQIQWDSHREPHIIDIGANVGVTALVFSQIPTDRIGSSNGARDYLSSTTSIPERSNSSFERGSFPARSVKRYLSTATI